MWGYQDIYNVEIYCVTNNVHYVMLFCLYVLMIRRPPRSTRTDTLFPYTTLFRSAPVSNQKERRTVSTNKRPGSGGWVRPIPTLLGPGQALADGLTIVVLLLQMEGIGHMAKIAAETGSFDCDLLELRRSPRFDAARSEERRGGKECVSTCRYRGSPNHKK